MTRKEVGLFDACIKPQESQRTDYFRALICRELHLTLLSSVFLQKDFLKEGEVWPKVFSKKIIVTLDIQGLPSSFPQLYSPVLLRIMSTIHPRKKETLTYTIK